MGKQLVHYGKLLVSNMEEKGVKREFVCTLLKISYETLRTRIEDARFSYDELRKLKDKGLL